MAAANKKLTDEEILYYAITESLYRNFQPFPGQIDVGKAIFINKVRMAFVRCGRGWGKSLSAGWIAAKYALENPKCTVYLVAPLYKQAKRIYWLGGVLDQFIHPDFIEQRSNQETYLVLKNGAQIFVDGSDNYDAHRGLKPNLVVADEYAEFDANWINVMMPNLAKTRGSLLVIGTPPEFPRLEDGSDHHYIQLRKQIESVAQERPDKAFFITAPTASNPFADKEFLEDEKKRLTELGMEYVYQREYDAIETAGSNLQIFPMFESRASHLYLPHDKLMEKISANPTRYDFGCFADPGTKSVFAVRFMALDRYLAEPFWLDEIYETNPMETVPSIICPRMKAKMDELAPHITWQDWTLVADNAAAGFIIDAATNHDMVFAPTVKQAKDKTDYLGVLGRIFLEKSGIISDRCERTKGEYSNYSRGPDGRPLKKNDHLIDADRYGLKYMGFDFQTASEPIPKIKNPIKQGRMISLEKDLRDIRYKDDWNSVMLGAYGE